ncbi:hypothetical protein KPH14_001147 [Odynerus spinipes]|uniref:Uncharacterized protein n=1 Tax=Odynerus spinipes TaxID=1348599 RepID=A0AAD9RQF0_9HYME|nr:hypothetical protein KPH14_001147 [Odynerus spinipes]
MIAATYDCGCVPGKITHGHPNCFESHSAKKIGPRYTRLRCQTTAPPPSCPYSDCCKPVRCGVPPSCGFPPSCGPPPNCNPPPSCGPPRTCGPPPSCGPPPRCDPPPSSCPPPSCYPPPSCSPPPTCYPPPSCGSPPSCGGVIPGCPNFDKIHNCWCSPEPPQLPDLPDDCTCGLKKEGCTINAQGECDPCSTQNQRVISQITKKGLPYKEIEAIINNNRMVIRMQKEVLEDDFDPPCDCPEGPGTGRNVAVKGSTSQCALASSKRCGDDIVYEMSDFSRPGYTHGGQNSMVKQSCDQNGKGGRTITLYPHPGVQNKTDEPEDREREKKEKRAMIEKAKAIRPIDLEENPNIFLLRIRKISNSSDGKHKLDFEFRTPRPWLTRKEPMKHPICGQLPAPQKQDHVIQDNTNFRPAHQQQNNPN